MEDVAQECVDGIQEHDGVLQGGGGGQTVRHSNADCTIRALLHSHYTRMSGEWGETVYCLKGRGIHTTAGLSRQGAQELIKMLQHTPLVCCVPLLNTGAPYTHSY